MKTTQQANHTEVAKALRDYMKEHHVSAETLARSLHVAGIRNYLRQEYAPSSWALRRMARAAHENGLWPLSEVLRKEMRLRLLGPDVTVDTPVEVLDLMATRTVKELAEEVLRLREELQAMKHSALTAHNT